MLQVKLEETLTYITCPPALGWKEVKAVKIFDKKENQLSVGRHMVLSKSEGNATCLSSIGS